MICLGTTVFSGTIMHEAQRATFSLRLPKETDDILTQMAARDRRSKNKLVEIILEKALRELVEKDKLLSSDKLKSHLET